MPLSLRLRNPHFKQVPSLIYFFYSLKHHSTTIQQPQPPPHSPSSSTLKTNNTHLNLPSLDFSGIAKSVLVCSNYWEKKAETFPKPSLKDLLLNICNLNPKIARRFFRVSVLKPEDVLQILLGFDCDEYKFEDEAETIQSLWRVFKWASEQRRDFKHLPQSCKLMSFLLVRTGMYTEAQFVLSTIESEEVLPQYDEIFSNLIEGYLREANIERVISNYDRMRELGVVPSLTCYRKLLKYLVQINETHLAFRVCLDMVDEGLLTSITDVNNVIHLLCRDRKIQEARNLVKKVINVGTEPSNLLLNAIASGYCEKKDYDDVLNFFAEMNRAPEALISNKIIHSVCRNFGVERAIYFIKKLEDLGFSPTEITLGILIGWSCREGKLKNAIIFLSEISSRSLKPYVYSYNAIMSGMFMEEGMWNHAQEIFNEMTDIGIVPDMSTYRVLLAGYCKARRFDEVKIRVKEMVDHKLIQLTEQEDLLTRGFMVLGLDPSIVKIRRDNDSGFSKTEFFDNLGNGLYLETDVVKFEKTMTEVLVDSMIPDYNSIVLKLCGDRDFKTALVLFSEMLQWGQELSLTAFSAVVKGLYQSGCNIKVITSLLEKMPKLANQIDQEILNSLVQAHCKNGYTHKATRIFDGMQQRRLQIDNKTYTDLAISLCKKGDVSRFMKYWELARVNNWLPELKDCKTLVGFLCHQQMFDVALEILETMVSAYPNLVTDTCHIWVQKLCDSGCTHIAHVLVEELMKKGFALDLVSYSHLIRGFCKEKKISEAFALCDIMLARNLAPEFDVSVLLIPLLCRAGCYAKALSLKETSLRDQLCVSPEVYCSLMSSFCKTGIMVKEAVNLLKDMLLKGLNPNTEVYNVLVQGFCLAKNYSKILELLGIMIRKKINFSISTYQKLVFVMCMEGSVNSAFILKELMLKETHLSNLVIYNTLIFYLFLSRNEVHVDTIFDELQEKGTEPDATTYNFLVYGFSRCKLLSRSIHYFTTMLSKEIRPSNRCLREVISCLCENGDLVNALKLSGEMESRSWVHSSIIQNKIVELLLSNGKIQEAVVFLDRMEEKGLIPNNVIYDKIIKRLCCIGIQEKAIDLLDIMLKKGNIPSCTSYDCVIQGLCKSNKMNEALDFHTEMMYRNLNPCIQTWNVLIHNLCEDGRTVEAERVLDSMAQIGKTPSREMYNSLCNRYRFESNFKKASEILKVMQKNGYEPDFEVHWSIVRNLSNSSNKDDIKNGSNFLSRLLSDSGFS